jgi:hypothetical protein
VRQFNLLLIVLDGSHFLAEIQTLYKETVAEDDDSFVG